MAKYWLPWLVGEFILSFSLRVVVQYSLTLKLVW